MSLSLHSSFHGYAPIQFLPSHNTSTQRNTHIISCRATISHTEKKTNFYQLLSLQSEAASVEEIKKAYRIMALVYHPDVCHPSRKEESTQMFLQLHKAYETLSDPILRKQHDRELGLNGVVNDEGEWEFARERWENQLCGLKMRSDYRMRRKEGKSFKGRMRAWRWIN